MTKHDIVLKSLFKSIQTNLHSGWNKYQEAKEIKAAGDDEMARYVLADAKMEVEHAEMIDDKIEYYMKKHELKDESIYKIFYCSTMENIEDLKNKISQMTI